MIGSWVGRDLGSRIVFPSADTVSLKLPQVKEKVFLGKQLFLCHFNVKQFINRIFPAGPLTGTIPKHTLCGGALPAVVALT